MRELPKQDTNANPTASSVSKSARVAQKCISLSFLGLVDTPHKIAKLWELYRLSNKDLGGLSLRPAKGP